MTCRRLAFRSLAPLAAALALCAGPALADEMQEEPLGSAQVAPTEPQAPEAAAPRRTLGERDEAPAPPDWNLAIDDWEQRRGWGYGTDYLLPLTRGMDEAGIPFAAQIPLYLVTVPFDLGQLFFGAIGGLYGD